MDYLITCINLLTVTLLLCEFRNSIWWENSQPKMPYTYQLMHINSKRRNRLYTQNLRQEKQRIIISYLVSNARNMNVKMATAFLIYTYMHNLMTDTKIWIKIRWYKEMLLNFILPYVFYSVTIFQSTYFWILKQLVSFYKQAICLSVIKSNILVSIQNYMTTTKIL